MRNYLDRPLVMPAEGAIEHERAQHLAGDTEPFTVGHRGELGKTNFTGSKIFVRNTSAAIAWRRQSWALPREGSDFGRVWRSPPP